MTSPETAIRHFLAGDESFAFDIRAYVESTLYAAEARDLLAQFQEALSAGDPQRSWEDNRQEYRAATAGVPGYAHVDWSAQNYWAALNLIDKSTLRESLIDFVNPRSDPNKWWVRETSGTTGPPVRIPYEPVFAVGYRLFSAYKIASLFGLDLAAEGATSVSVLSLVERLTSPRRVWADPTGLCGLTLQMPFAECDRGSVGRLCAVVHRYSPRIVALKPNMLETLIGRADGCLDFRGLGVELVISGGAHLSASTRSLAETLLRVPVCNEYGLTEIGLVASECRKRTLHLYEHVLLAEILHDDGSIQPDGTGELVISSIANPALPLLRYRTGDIVTAASGSCACGQSTRMLPSLNGRIIRNFTFSDGTQWSPTHLEALFRAFPLREYKVKQSASDAVLVELLLESDAAPSWRQIKLQVGEYVQREVGNGVRVEVVRLKGR